ncbi:hypothetical protein EUGRSUZ_B00159 [Eucalyptus grandis]|uniref:Uncharacterized protein n=2 Tax=Eucalyptus grandis TaxID=71139 RepID=A0ACC3LL96_EUCGR|nr:hypothetical protein EUGRSUZ_B00159 [Eucalyptus grandis]
MDKLTSPLYMGLMNSNPERGEARVLETLTLHCRRHCGAEPSPFNSASMGPKRGGKAAVAGKKKQEKVTNPLFEKRPKQFGIGGALPPKRDLTRFVKFPKTVQIQRKRRILRQRLKVPPALNQFTKTLDKNLATNLFKMLLKYRPEDKKTASALCLTTVKNEDKLEFSKILEAIKANFNDKYDEYRKKWGGGIMGSKSQAKTKAKERVLAKEAAQRMN